MEPVAIIGLGLGGLVLARILRLRGIAAIVYEADPTAEARTQGGLLDIHEQDGQAALAAAGLLPAFFEAVHVGGQAVRVLDAQGRLLFEEADDGSGGRPEVLRGELRRILLGSLPTGTVRWGCKLKRVRSLGEGRHELTFADSLQVTTALLVGADGAWSRVRPLLCEAKPEYVGTTFCETYLRDVDALHPATALAAGAGAMFALAPGQGIFSHREPGGDIHAYVALTRSAAWLSALEGADDAETRLRIAAEFEGWAPELTALITEAEAAPVIRPLYALPSGVRWKRTPGVILIGDAAHLAPPAGEGANLALLDGAELAAALTSSQADVEGALSAFEDAMFTRSAAAAVQAHRTLQLCLDERAPASLVDFFADAFTAGRRSDN